LLQVYCQPEKIEHACCNVFTTSAAAATGYHPEVFERERPNASDIISELDM
jgi:molecular chaperone DnaK (HSP70)